MDTMKNKYIVRFRISEKKFREILKYFAEDIEASKISNLTKISESTLCRIFREIRILMFKECEKISKSYRLEVTQIWALNFQLKLKSKNQFFLCLRQHRQNNSFSSDTPCL